MKAESSLFIILLLVIAFYSCDKDEYSGDQFRVKEWKTYFKDNLVEYTYLKYSGDRLTAIYTEGLDFKMGVEYPSDDTVIVNDYKHYDESDSWTPFRKYIMESDNGKIIQSISSIYSPHEYKWYLEWKYNFNYVDSLLVEVLTSSYVTINWAPALRKTINYDGDRRIGFHEELYQTTLGGWSNHSEGQYVYSNDHVYQVMTNYFSEDEIYETKTETYTYQNDFIVKINLNRTNHGSDLPEMIFTFEYDTFGNMIARTVGITDVDFRTEYTYERGIGNNEDLFHLGYTIEPNTVLPWSYFSATGM